MDNESVVVHPPVMVDPHALVTGDFAFIIYGVDDVFDCQLCRVGDPDNPDVTQVYSPGNWVPVLCWTGYMAWTPYENLVRITGDLTRLDLLFRIGHERSGSEEISF